MAARPWAWGEFDCTMAVATWIDRIIGADPLWQYRGRYHTPEEARETAKEAGGFLPTIGMLFDGAGLRRTQDFEDGDVAAISAGLHERFMLPVVGCILAIRCGSLWVCKARRGIVGREFQVIMGWRL